MPNSLLRRDSIELAYMGADGLWVNEAGQLEIETAWGMMTEEAPLAWQEAGGQRALVEVCYALRPGGRVGFAVGPYDAHKPLVIDPTLNYSTFVGGSGDDYVESLAIDGSGNVVVTGGTRSSDFPTTPGAYDTSYNGDADVFVFKLSADGTSLLYSTFVGGSGSDYGYSLAIDGAGKAVVTGETWSSDFPTTAGAYDTSFNGGYHDVFVFKLSVDGASFLYSTFVGGSDGDSGYSLALDRSGNAVVTGETYSSDFPTTPWAYDRSHNGYCDVFVFKLSANGRWLEYSTFVGGSLWDWGHSLAIDGFGKAVVTGYTQSSDFPTTWGAYDRSYNGGGYVPWGGDVFVLKLPARGTSLLYSTFVGGGRAERGDSLALDRSGNALVTGWTESSDFPTTPGAYDTSFNGGEVRWGGDVFVFKLSAHGASLLYSTFVGGGHAERCDSLALDRSGNAVVTGGTHSSDFPTTPGAYDTSHNGDYDVFVLKLSADGASLEYSTFVGGSGSDRGYSLALDGSGNALVTGWTESTDFPTSPGAYDRSYNGGWGDVFVLRLDLLPEKMYLPLILKDY